MAGHVRAGQLAPKLIAGVATVVLVTFANSQGCVQQKAEDGSHFYAWVWEHYAVFGIVAAVALGLIEASRFFDWRRGQAVRLALKSIHAHTFSAPGGGLRENYRVSLWVRSRRGVEWWKWWFGWRTYKCWHRTVSGTTKKRWRIGYNSEGNGLVARLFELGGVKEVKALPKSVSSYPDGDVNDSQLLTYLSDGNITIDDLRKREGKFAGGAIWGIGVQFADDPKPSVVILIECSDRSAKVEMPSGFVAHAEFCAMLWERRL